MRRSPKPISNSLVLASLFACLLVASVKGQELLNIFVNNIAPLGSPSETYKYYSLPFIRPENEVKSDQSFSQSLSGDRVYNSPYISKIGGNTPALRIGIFQLELKHYYVAHSYYYLDKETIRTIGQKSFSEFEIEQFTTAIHNNFYAEFYIEDFVSHDMIGTFIKNNKTQEIDFYIKHHIEFNVYLDVKHKEEYPYCLLTWAAAISMPKKDIIYANITSRTNEDNFELYYTQLVIPEKQERVEVTFTYEVNYIYANLSDIRYERDQIFEDFEKANHITDPETNSIGIGIIISFSLVIGLVAFVSILLAKILKRDFSISKESDNDLSFEIGWKMIKTEALMPPDNKIILSSFLGNGIQFIFMLVNLFVFGSLGMYYNTTTQKGNVKQIGLFLYAFTGVFNGYYSNKYYKFFGGKHWALTFISSAVFFPISLLFVFSIVNSYAWYNDSTTAIPAEAVLIVILIIVFIFGPLTLVGTLTSRIKTSEVLANANITLPRLFKPIPERKLIQQPIGHFLIGGFIPFVSICLQLDQVFNNVWGYSSYHLYGVVTISFVLLLAVQACVSITLTFIQLNAMDYNWWWRSFSYGGSTSLFIGAYVVYYYWQVSQMHGTLQFLVYFGYMVLACIASFLMMGSVSFLASIKFVRYIYNNSKMD